LPLRGSVQGDLPVLLSLALVQLPFPGLLVRYGYALVFIFQPLVPKVHLDGDVLWDMRDDVVVIQVFFVVRRPGHSWAEDQDLLAPGLYG
jgi:hypothetical protein